MELINKFDLTPVTKTSMEWSLLKSGAKSGYEVLAYGDRVYLTNSYNDSPTEYLFPVDRERVIAAMHSAKASGFCELTELPLSLKVGMVHEDLALRDTSKAHSLREIMEFVGLKNDLDSIDEYRKAFDQLSGVERLSYYSEPVLKLKNTRWLKSRIS